jgi:arylsulfatase A-like enzyme
VDSGDAQPDEEQARKDPVSGRAPNILIVMSDQHRADMMGCAGDASMRTPSLDALAAEGVRFSRVSCQGPLCMPSRASFMTERYVRDHGVYTNWGEIAPDSPTYVRALREAGYHTALLGKAHLYLDEKLSVSHMDEMAGRLEALGFAEVFETGDKFVGKIPTRYTDFLSGRGLLGAYKKHIADRSYQGENEDGQNATKCVPMWDSTPMPLPLDAYVDTWHGERAVQWVEGYDRDEPFFLFLGFPGPHDPWDAPEEAVRRYDGVDISMPGSTRRPDVEGTGRYGALINSFLWVSDSETMSDDAIRGMRRSYAADISVIDRAVGQLVDALARKGMLDDTWIVYTSDHGEMAGSHGLMSKCVLYEPAVRVPLIIRPPGGCSPRVLDALVEQLDVPATARAIAGAPELEHSEGRSLLPALSGEPSPAPRRVTVSENWGFAAFETERHKLVVDEDALEPCQLFDLVEDAVEDRNLLADPLSAPVVDEIMETHVRPFFRSPPARPHPSLFTGGYD